MDCWNNWMKKDRNGQKNFWIGNDNNLILSTVKTLNNKNKGGNQQKSIIMVKRMEKYKKFWEAVDIEYTEKEGKRKEKSKYYTKELLEKYGVKKYVNLVLDYEFIAFKPLLHCKDFNPETNEEGKTLFFDLDFSDEVYENGRKKLIWYSEKIHKQKYGKNAKKIEVNYEELDNYIPIISGRYYSYIYISKETNKIVQYSSYSDLEDESKGVYWKWTELAENFDEFIEKLYVDPKDNKEMSKEEKEQLTKFVDGLLEQLDEERQEMIEMDRQKHLEEILEIEDCEVRDEERYYYDDEFIESLGIEKEEYRDMVKKYSEIYFKETVYILIDDENINDKFISYLYFDDETVERGKNMLIEFDEREYEKNPDLKRTYFWRNNYVAIGADEDEYIFISKETKEIFMYYFAEDTHKIFTEGGNREKWKWIKLGDNFDEFIDKLYLKK